MKAMQVEIWSDVVCPWCYIGKRRFESALATFKHREQIEIVWKSFELDPNAPSTSEDTLNQMLAKKYGMSAEKAAEAAIVNTPIMIGGISVFAICVPSR